MVLAARNVLPTAQLLRWLCEVGGPIIRLYLTPYDTKRFQQHVGPKLTVEFMKTMKTQTNMTLFI